MSTERPTSYAELADVIANLPLLLREARRARGLSMRKAATELDMSQSTVMRMEEGRDCALSNAVAVLKWLDPALTPREDASRVEVRCETCGGPCRDESDLTPGEDA